MWYTVAFIAGAFLGVMVMAVLASATLDKLEWENAHLSRILSNTQKNGEEHFTPERAQN